MSQAMSRREMLKLGGAAGAALQLGCVAGAAFEAGRDRTSYPGWESFEGCSQVFDRPRFAIAGAPYVKVGPTRRPDKATEFVFARAHRLRRAMAGSEEHPGWCADDGIDALGEPLTSYYRDHPEVLALDLQRETVIFEKAAADREKYGGYFELAEAWSAGWADVFGRYPPQPEGPPEESDFAGIRSEPLPPKSPDHAAELIKRVAHLYGATLVGIARLNPDWVYDSNVRGGQSGPFAVPEHWEYAIAFGVPHEWDQLLSNPAHGTSYDAYARAAITAGRLTAFLRALGYPARAHCPPVDYDLIVPPILVDAGLGQQGRNGTVITPELGANFRAAVVTTNLPMTVDRPIDFGVAEFCTTCKICAEQCPSGSISFADSNQAMTTRGYVHWEINQTSCYNFWESAMGPRGCRLCIANCPYSRKDNWLHALARSASVNDPTGVSDRAMTWLQKRLFAAPEAPAYLPPPDGRFAGYRPPPEWLEISNWFDVRVTNPPAAG